MYFIINQIAVLNVVGSNPTGYPEKSLKPSGFRDFFFLCSKYWDSGIPWGLRKWVLGRMTIKEISGESSYSERQLQRWFSEYLENVQEWTIPRHRGIHLLVDGTWLPDGRCIFLRSHERQPQDTPGTVLQPQCKIHQMVSLFFQ